MIFQIRDWHTFDDYIANKTKKYRDQYKGHEKKQKGLRKERRNHNYNSRIYQLYMNVTKMLHSTPFI
jgi:hypothetical protein